MVQCVKCGCRIIEHYVEVYFVDGRDHFYCPNCFHLQPRELMPVVQCVDFGIKTALYDGKGETCCACGNIINDEQWGYYLLRTYDDGRYRVNFLHSYCYQFRKEHYDREFQVTLITDRANDHYDIQQRAYNYSTRPDDQFIEPSQQISTEIPLDIINGKLLKKGKGVSFFAECKGPNMKLGSLVRIARQFINSIFVVPARGDDMIEGIVYEWCDNTIKYKLNFNEGDRVLTWKSASEPPRNSGYAYCLVERKYVFLNLDEVFGVTYNNLVCQLRFTEKLGKPKPEPERLISRAEVMDLEDD